jgi:uncharacterized protein (DUF1786 family)
MGGGPGAWAVEDHINAGLPVYATPDAGRTFDDDLERVAAMGVRIVTPEDLEAMRSRLGPSESTLIRMQDVTLAAVHEALRLFDEPAEYDGLAVAVFDHGAAPPGYSDRRFRFDYISHQMQDWGSEPVERALAAFAAPAGQIHPDLTRLLAVAATIHDSPQAHLPLLLMDTGPAALLGALGDPTVRRAADDNTLFVNIGNFHTLAFHIVGGRIRALFEHHTGLVDGPKVVRLLEQLAAGTLTSQEIFDDSGHGALNLAPNPSAHPVASIALCAVTGPRRAMLAGISAPWPIYMAVPHGDMMLAGCYGLLRAYGAHFPEHRDDILRALRHGPTT